MTLRNAAWFLLVGALLVIVFGTAAAGRLTGVGTFTLAPPGSNSSLGKLGGAGAFSTTTTENTTAASGGFRPVALLGSWPGAPFHIPLPYWLLFVAVAAGLGAGLVLMLRSSGATGVFDFAAAIEQLDRERSAMESGSTNLRNLALLQYYTVLKAVLDQMGLAEKPSETPKEYLTRAAVALKIDEEGARRFATAFERARYGEELTDYEARGAASSMGAYVDGLRERTSRV